MTPVIPTVGVSRPKPLLSQFQNTLLAACTVAKKAGQAGLAQLQMVV